jgi:hypothetical protein
MAESSEPGLLYAGLSRVKGEGGEGVDRIVRCARPATPHPCRPRSYAVLDRADETS